MPEIIDSEFGEIKIRTSSLSKKISIKLAPSGNLMINAPNLTPRFVIKSVINKSRSQIRKMVDEQRTLYLTDQQVGKSHSLVIELGGSINRVQSVGTQIIAKAPSAIDLAGLAMQQDIRAQILKALRKEAKSHLPRRLSYLAQQHGFSYKATKITHASSRWGSCSSSGTISMNISLMQLPFELLDYVLIHELCHTVHMNHSDQFWDLVERYDADFKKHRKALKKYTPTI